MSTIQITFNAKFTLSAEVCDVISSSPISTCQLQWVVLPEYATDFLCHSILGLCGDTKSVQCYFRDLRWHQFCGILLVR